MNCGKGEAEFSRFFFDPHLVCFVHSSVAAGKRYYLLIISGIISMWAGFGWFDCA